MPEASRDRSLGTFAKNMRHLYHFVFFTSLWFSLSLKASESSPPVTPILISVDSSATDTDRILLNTASFELEDAKVWLADTSDKFGRKDPIIIQITKMEDFSVMRKVATMADDFYDDIFFKILTYDVKHPFLFLRFDSSEAPFPEIPWGIENKQ